MGDWKILVTTNRDVINRMSDEQLANWALNVALGIGRRYNSSLGGLTQWLGEEAARLEYRRIEK